MMKMKNASMKKQSDCKNPIILFLRGLESMLEWLRQPLEK